MSSPAMPQTRGDWEQLLRTLGVRPSKAMGQSFLVDPPTIDRIVDVAGVASEDIVLEIGPGLGVLTTSLADRAARVVAVELDRELAAYLRGLYGDVSHVSIVESDARFVNPSELGLPPGYKVVANLPYGVATVILRRLLESDPHPATLTVMVQREVAERMTAHPPNMSLLGVATQLYADAHIAFVVPPRVFSPPPRVESAIVNLVPRQELLLDARQREALFRLATLAFQAKRKTLTNALAHRLGWPKAEVEEALRHDGIDPMRRPQTLAVAEWTRLARGPLGQRAA